MDDRIEGHLLNLSLPEQLPERRGSTTVSAEDGDVKVLYYPSGDAHPAFGPFIVISGNSAQSATVWLSRSDESPGTGRFSSTNLEGGPIFDGDAIKKIIEDALARLTSK